MRLEIRLFVLVIFLGLVGHSVAFAQSTLAGDPGTCGMPPFDGPPYCFPDSVEAESDDGTRDVSNQPSQDDGQTLERTDEPRALPNWNYSITGQSF